MLRSVEPSQPTAALPPKRVSRWLVVVLLAVGLVAGLMVLHSANRASPVTVATVFEPHGPLTAATAGAALLALRPATVEGTNVADMVGIPLEQAMLEATGNQVAPGGRFPGRVTVAPDASGRGYLVTVVLPVNVPHLLRAGDITVGWWPGSSNMKTGLLNVTVKAGQVYGIRMNPRTHVAVFRFDIARSGQNVASLNWNANAVLEQTDGSDALS
jgi:hypothetical protein